MDRLTRELDSLLATGSLHGEVIITAAAYGHRPVRARALGIQPYDRLVEMVGSAMVVITHGGPASIALALAAGHSPIVVPRDPAFGEHVDDHQLRFAAWLAAQRDITVVTDVSRLEDAIRDHGLHHGPVPAPARTPVAAIGRLRQIIAGDGPGPDQSR
jgi:UDP-N-acetylglucosamine transferase subunit ALG13